MAARRPGAWSPQLFSASHCRNCLHSMLVQAPSLDLGVAKRLITLEEDSRGMWLA